MLGQRIGAEAATLLTRVQGSYARLLRGTKVRERGHPLHGRILALAPTTATVRARIAIRVYPKVDLALMPLLRCQYICKLL